MSRHIEIKQATAEDIPLIEGILLNAIEWLAATGGMRVWTKEQVTWTALAKDYKVEDFFIAYLEGLPAGCISLWDYDPFFWPEVPPGESLFLHKLAVVQAARKTGVSTALMDYFKEAGRARGMTRVLLETNGRNPKQRQFYEEQGFTLLKEQTVLHPSGREGFHAYYAYYLR